MSKSKLSYIMGTATIVLIVGGTIYAIKKSKELEASEEPGEVIDIEEARRMIRVRRADEEVIEEEDEIFEEVEDPFEFDEIQTTDIEHAKSAARADGVITSFAHREEIAQEANLEEMIDDARDEAGWNSSFAQPTELAIIEDPVIEEVILNARSNGHYQDNLKHTINEEENNTLRYDPHSQEALNQFKHMELADWSPSNDVYRIMDKLFDFDYIPDNTGDHFVKSKLIDNRMEFFGNDSFWNAKVSYADLILHYARLITYNCGEGVKHWVEVMVSNISIGVGSTSHQIDEILDQLNNHGYYNSTNDTFGLFGLDNEYFENALKVSGNTIDQLLTYDIEFNEFVKYLLS